MSEQKRIRAHKRSYYVINGITFYRIVTVPLLLYLLFVHRIFLFGILLSVSFFTDAIDGFLARKFKVTSVFGARLDSIGDDLTVGVALVGVGVCRPGFLKEEFILIAILAIALLIENVLALYKYKKLTSFHTLAAKIAAVLQAAFLITFFFFQDEALIFFYPAAICTSLQLIEESVLVLLLPKYRTNVKGIYWLLKERKNIQSGL